MPQGLGAWKKPLHRSMLLLLENSEEKLGLFLGKTCHQTDYIFPHWTIEPRASLMPRSAPLLSLPQPFLS